MAALPGIATGDLPTDRALRVALGDVLGNVGPVGVGLLPPGTPALMAGLTYEAWTRDAAINCWNMLNATHPDLARNTLLGEVVTGPDGYRLRGQYWDAVVWVLGAWDHALWTGDRQFLILAREVSVAWLARMERDEFDPDLGLFRGPACFQDGVAGYPDRYADAGGKSCILDWVHAHPADRHPVGQGMPMHCLSTNCLYQRAYAVLGEMDRWLGRDPDPHHADMAARVRTGLMRHLWMPEAGRFRYLVDRWGSDDRQEGLGHGFAGLFGLLPDVGRLATAPAGLPCVTPGYDRYAGLGVGRHSGLIWPHVEGFVAEAAARTGRPDLAWRTIERFTSRAVRDGQFTECCHPDTGLPNGGVQEITVGAPEDWHAWCIGPRVGTAQGHPVHAWKSQPRTTWGATALWRLAIRVLAGLDPRPDGLRIRPSLPPTAGPMRLTGLHWRDATLDLRIEPGRDHRVLVDGRPAEAIPADAAGEVSVRLIVA